MKHIVRSKKKYGSPKKTLTPLDELEKSEHWRVQALRVFFILFAGIIVLKLLTLQVLDHAYYGAIASGQHEIFENLFPQRGEIFVHERGDDQLYPVATMKPLTFVWADPRHIVDPDGTVEKLDSIFGWTEEERQKRIKELKEQDGQIIDSIESPVTEEETTDRRIKRRGYC